jgi:hypothetical protein
MSGRPARSGLHRAGDFRGELNASERCECDWLAVVSFPTAALAILPGAAGNLSRL